jgi:SpoVK/Ycf46/Vps4 family AAA+-type ATPase
MKNSVLCIEDAEDILRSRVSTHNTAVTNILNMTDGLLGKIANLKIICTLNHEEDIDRALLRRGRLKLKYEFKPLSAEKATKLAKKLGKDVEFKEEMLLSDIYNYGEIVDFDNPEPDINKKKIGFTK